MEELLETVFSVGSDPSFYHVDQFFIITMIMKNNVTN
jgi:hypothetical protein